MKNFDSRETYSTREKKIQPMRRDFDQQEKISTHEKKYSAYKKKILTQKKNLRDENFDPGAEKMTSEGRKLGKHAICEI